MDLTDRNNFDREYWYNYVDIDMLLKDKCDKQYYVCDATSQHPNHFNHTIKNVCEKLKSRAEQSYICNTATIPVNIGHSNNGKYEGLHWVSLVIKMNLDQHLEAFYCDSFGIPLNESLKSILINNGINDIHNFSKRQQNNTYDCGPLLVFNLDSLAKTGDLPHYINENSILDQRLTLKRLTQFRNIDSNLTDFIRSESKIPTPRQNDFCILERILEAVLDCETNPSDLRITLITIGWLAGDISYNDLNDKENHHIRNKYGYIQRNNNKSINLNGIYFEQIYHLKIILSDDEIYSSIPDKEFDLLRSQLVALKQKIAHIFEEEKTSTQQRDFLIGVKADFSASIAGIIDFSRTYYDSMLIKKVNEELKQLEDVDVSIKADRYYMARIFCIIGELMSELCEDRDKKVKESVVMQIFKDLNKLRDKFVHYYDKIKFGFKESNENQLINDLIISVKTHLLKVIVQKDHNYGCQWGIDFAYAQALGFRGVVKQLTDHIVGQTEKKTETPVNKFAARQRQKNDKAAKSNIIEEMEFKLNRYIKGAWDAIDKKASDSKLQNNGKKPMKSIDEQLVDRNKCYEPLLKSLVDNIDTSRYPPSLDLAHGEAIKMCSEWIDGKPKPPRSEVGRDTNQKSNFNMVKLYETLEAMKAEGEYLIDFSNSEIVLGQIHTRRQQYVLQYIMLIIGQLMRDINGLGICKPVPAGDYTCAENENFAYMLPILDKLSSSILLTDASFTTMDSRKRGLAHNIWAFDEEKFNEGLKEMLEVFEHLESVCNVIQTSNEQESVDRLNNKAISFLDLGMYDQAIDYTKKAIARYELYPFEYKMLNSDESGDEHKLIFGMAKPAYLLQRNLALIYIGQNNTGKACEVLEFITKDINIGHCSDTMLKEISGMYCNMHFHLRAQQKHEEAIAMLLKAESYSEHFTIKLFLAELYFAIKEYDKAQIFCEKIINDAPHSIDKFGALETYINICVEQKDRNNRISEIKDCIDKMEILLQTDLGQFKSAFRDKYLTMKLIIINAKLDLIIKHFYENRSENTEEKFEITQLLELEKEFIIINGKFKEKPQNDEKFVNLVLNFCCSFCICNESNIYLDSNGKNLKKAENYFDLATKSIELFPEILSEVRRNVRNTAMSLTRAYNTFAMSNKKLTREVRIEYLRIALHLQNKYNLKHIETLSNLGSQFQALGDKYFDLHEENALQETADQALVYFTNAVNYYTLKNKYLKDEKDVISIYNTKMDLAHCYFSMLWLQYELRLFKESLSYFDELLRLNLSITNELVIRKYKELSESMMTDITEVLHKILNDDFELEFESPYIIEYCAKRFKIQITEEENTMRWSYPKHLSMDRLKNQILVELNYPKEAFLLCQFYRVLLTGGYLEITSNGFH